MLQTITITSKDILHKVKLSGKISEFTEAILAYKIIVAAAAEVGIKVEPQELQKAADLLRLSKQILSAEDTWAWLEKHSLSLDDFEELVYNRLLAGKLAEHLFADKVEPYFFENQLDYAGVVMYEVVLDDQDLAIELFYAIQEGEISFYDVAHKYIQDTELRRKGGYRGIVRRKDLKPEISASVFAVNPPQLLKPVVTSSGVHLILVEEIILPQLDEKLRSQILSDFFDNWMEQKSSNFQIQNSI